MTHKHLIERVDAYYSGKLSQHGANARGVDWKSEESQLVRFRQLLSVCRDDPAFTILDFGCGYGALSAHLHDLGRSFRYCGYDVSEAMIKSARSIHGECSSCTFESQREKLEPADYAVASGVFNVKLDATDAEWAAYVLDSIAELDKLGAKGFAFNMLTVHSDPDRMRPDLFYGDPAFYFDQCMKRFSRWVALYHDYGLYEFTLIVRKAGYS